MAEPLIDVHILSEYEELFAGKAQRVIVPGAQGVFEILKYHHPIVSLLLPGNIVVDNKPYPILRGVVHVTHETVTAIVESAGVAA